MTEEFKSSIKVGIAQIECYIGNVERNLKKHFEYIDKALSEDVEILVFPELSLTGFILKDIVFHISEECVRALDEIKRYVEKMLVIVGFVEEPRKGIYYNSAALISHGKVIGLYSKLYLPAYAPFEDPRYYAQGELERLRVYEYKGWGLGVQICEDMWHPEPCEILARRGADIVFTLAASPLRGLYGRKTSWIEEAWQSLLKARALENCIYVCFANRVGEEEEEFFYGRSCIVDPFGDIVAEAPRFREHLLVGELDLRRIKFARQFSSFKQHIRDLHRILATI